MKNPSYGPVAAALRLLCQSDDQFKNGSGFRELKDLADADDMTTATHLGYAFHFEHLGHYDFNARREYQEGQLGQPGLFDGSNEEE